MRLAGPLSPALFTLERRAGICYPRLSHIGHILGYTVYVTEDGLFTVDLCPCMKNKAGSTCIHEALMNLSSLIHFVSFD